MLSFDHLFGFAPAAAASAPGRVNLLGEHTDYSGGFVLPIGTRETTCVEIAASADPLFHLFSVNLNERVSFARGDSPQGGFQRYVAGCVAVLESAGIVIPCFCLRIESHVPIGVGLSSSAALEVALLRVLRQWLQLSLTDVEIAQFAQKAEIDHVGVRCGIMDQMASSLGDATHMLFLDTRSLAFRRHPLPENSEVLVLDTGTSRQLGQTAYNQRREECEQAARLLHVESLRDADDLSAINALPPPYGRRARHVVSENGRVLAAIDASPFAFGALMNASHASLRDDYEVSSPALDALAASLQREADVFGARLTGAGFGGACVALVRRGASTTVAAAALKHFAAMGFKGGDVL